MISLPIICISRFDKLIRLKLLWSSCYDFKIALLLYYFNFNLFIKIMIITINFILFHEYNNNNNLMYIE